MSESIDPFAVDAPIKSEAEKRGLTREQAIEEGKRAARLECIQLKRRRPDVYTDAICAERVIRADEYAAWEYDGRQAGTIGRIKDPFLPIGHPTC